MKFVSIVNLFDVESLLKKSIFFVNFVLKYFEKNIYKFCYEK